MFRPKRTTGEKVEREESFERKRLAHNRGGQTRANFTYQSSVLPNDTGNREAQASRIYFKALFGSNFRRHSTDDVNSALNYVYTIILSFVNRTVVSYGYHTALGIKHCSKVNPYNLSCDIMEPFRPVADKIVFENKERKLDWDYKKQLIEVLSAPLLFAGMRTNLKTAIGLYAADIFKKMKDPEYSMGEIAFYE